MAGFSLGSWLLGSSEETEKAPEAAGFSLSSIWGNAAAPQQAAKPQQEEIFHCFACYKTFTNTKGLRPPKCLPCGHFVCRPCVESVTSLSGARLCPLLSCKKLIIGDADRQPLAFSLLNILERSSSEATDLTEDKICLHCKEDVATGYCAGCTRFPYMCGPCGMIVHEKIEATSTPVQKLAHKPEPLHSPSICRTHPGVVLRHFCERCLQMVCDTCLKQSHSYCTRWILTLPLSEKDAVRLLEVLEKQLPGLAKLYPQLTEARDELAGLQASVTRRCDLSASHFSNVWQKWEAALKERKKELEKALEEIYNKRKGHIRGQTHCMAAALHSVETARASAGYAVSEQGLSAEGNMLRILMAIQQSAQLLKLAVKVDVPLFDFGFVANGDESAVIASLGRALDAGVEEGKEPGELITRIKPAQAASSATTSTTNPWATPRQPGAESPEHPAPGSTSRPGSASSSHPALASTSSAYLLAAARAGGAQDAGATGTDTSTAPEAAAPLAAPKVTTALLAVGSSEVDVSQCLVFGRAAQGIMCGEATDLHLVLRDASGVAVNLLRVSDLTASLKLPAVPAASGGDPKSKAGAWGPSSDVSINLELDVQHVDVGVYKLAFTPPYLGVWVGEAGVVAIEVSLAGCLFPGPLLRAVRVRQLPLPGCVAQHMARGRATWFAGAAVLWQQGRVAVVDISSTAAGGGQVVAVHEAPRAGGQFVKQVAVPAAAKRVLLAAAPPPSPAVTAAVSSLLLRYPSFTLNDAGDRFVLAAVTESSCEVSLASLSGAAPAPWVRLTLDPLKDAGGSGHGNADMAAVNGIVVHPRGTLLVVGRGGLVRLYGWCPVPGTDASPAKEAGGGAPARDTPWKHQLNLSNVLPDRIALSSDGARAVLLPDNTFAVLLVERGSPEDEARKAAAAMVGVDASVPDAGGSSRGSSSSTARLACVILSPDGKVLSSWVAHPPAGINFSSGIEASATHSGDLVVAVSGSSAVLVLSSATGAVATAFDDSQDLEAGFDKREMPKGACVVRYFNGGAAVGGAEAAPVTKVASSAGRGGAAGAGEEGKGGSMQYGLQVQPFTPYVWFLRVWLTP
eukprot:jgi/Mesvir1/25925/Mv20922-RA.2